MRRRYYVLVSILYLILGAIILVRSVLAHGNPAIVILGIVFLALGIVRLRAYFVRPEAPRG